MLVSAELDRVELLILLLDCVELLMLVGVELDWEELFVAVELD